MKIHHLLIFLLLPSISFAQFKNYNTENASWYYGEVVLNNGEHIHGEIVYNFVNNSLKIVSEENQLFYGTRNVSQFSLEDSLGFKIKYYTLFYDLSGSGNEIPLFFKVLYENEYIAILSKKKFEFKKQKQVYTAGLNDFFAYLRLVKYLESVQENIYIADTSGKMYHFLSSNKIKSSSYELDFYQPINYNSKEVSERKKNSKIKFKIERANALDLIFGDYLFEIKEFIKRDNLNVKDLDDLAKIFEFYSGLL